MKTKPPKQPSCWTRKSAGSKGENRCDDERETGEPNRDAGDERKETPSKVLSEEERILSDIEQFYANVKEVPRTEANAYVLDLAAQYCEDTKYFLQKKDYVTAFGAINYAHGLIDAFRKANEKDE